MKNIITAIDNNEINEKLKEEKEINIVSKDISYKEGILEQIEKNRQIDLIIMDEKIDGQVSLNELVRKIKEKIRNIEIIIITNNKAKTYEEVKKFKKIKIYETNRIKIKKLIEKINGESGEKIEIQEKQKTARVLSIDGAEGSGKTLITVIFSKMMQFHSTLMIDYNQPENQDIPAVLEIKKTNNVQKINRVVDALITNRREKVEQILNKNNYVNIFIDMGKRMNEEEKLKILKKCDRNMIIVEPTILGIKHVKPIIEKYINEYKIEKEKLLILINRVHEKTIVTKAIREIFKEIEIIGELKQNPQYEEVINRRGKNVKITLGREEMSRLKGEIWKKIWIQN